MFNLSLKDNSFKSLSDLFAYSDRDTLMSPLLKIEKLSVSEVINEKSKSLFIFANADKIEDEKIIQLNSDDNIMTGNIAGFIGLNDLQINISSRFAENEEDYFLHYMLSKVFNINLANLKHNQEKSSIFDFLILLFPYYLKQAFRKGLFRKYNTFHYNDPNIKGAINVTKFIQRDIPFTGNVTYTTREYSTDNHLTELVRHTIEFIKVGRYKSILEETSSALFVKAIIESTPSYDKNDRQMIIGKNLTPIRHPYYSEWTDLQRLCLMILRHNKIKYANESKKQIYGILFDVAWLWEAYLNILLASYHFKHPNNKTGEGRIYLFNDNTGYRYPDFYNDEYVLDAKYKTMPASVEKIDREDLHQMITYLHILNPTPKTGVFLYPIKEKAVNSCLKSKTLNGKGGMIKAEGLIIPSNVTSFEDFSARIEANAIPFINNLLSKK